MTYNTNLEDFGVTDVDSGEVIRDDQYKKILKDISKRQMEVYWEVFKHPSGVSTKEVALILRRSLHSLSGRFTELSNPKGYDKRPYCNPPLIEFVGRKVLPNEIGEMTGYSVYRVCNGFNGGDI